MINVSNKLKVSEVNFRSKAITRTIALSKSARFSFEYVRDVSNQGKKSAGKFRQVHCLYCTRVTLISMEEGTSLVWRKAPHLYGGRHLISMEEDPLLVCRNAFYLDSLNINDLPRPT